MSAAADTLYDLAVIGGGINGTGIARDAAGRGLRVLLVEMNDLAAHTSSASTKLIHGGLRYLEYYEFRLVAEALAEREVLLRIARHIIEPLQFVLPHEPHLRPAWMIRCGLFLYDHLGGRTSLPSSFGVDLHASRWGAGLKDRFARGFVYSDARVDDARLVVLNAIGARELGADIRTRTCLLGAQRDATEWRLRLAAASGKESTARARVLVNATGPWVKQVRELAGATSDRDGVRHVKGSHIVVPRVHDEPHAYILQNPDNRIIFVIPYQDRFSLIGTTDIPVEAYQEPAISREEIDYLCVTVNAYLLKPVAPSDIVWTYSGVRPLYDDGSYNPSAITRDYVFKLDAEGGAPLLSVFGGKITTYRKLAEAALALLVPYFPTMRRPWTHGVPLPGGDFVRGDLGAGLRELQATYPALPESYLCALLRRHGTRASRVLGSAQTLSELGANLGPMLYAKEIDYLVAEEWALSAEDVLWRRTKCGLQTTPAQWTDVAAYLDRRHAVV